MPVWIGLKQLKRAFAFQLFFLLFYFLYHAYQANFFLLFIHCCGYCSWIIAAKFDFFSTFSAQISLFSNFFIKNGSHDTIHTFKNYFTTIFFSFQFSAVSKQTLYQKNLRLVLKDSKSLLQLILTKSQGNSTLHKWKFNTKFNGHKKLQKVTRLSWLAQEVYLLLKENVGN